MAKKEISLGPSMAASAYEAIMKRKGEEKEKPMENKTKQQITVSDCARCGQTHKVEFQEFDRFPIELDGESYTHWGMCPLLHEPILMRTQ